MNPVVLERFRTVGTSLAFKIGTVAFLSFGGSERWATFCASLLFLTADFRALCDRRKL